METTKEHTVFYNHFLKLQIEKRNEALELFEKCDHTSIYRNYIQYLDTEAKEEELTDLSIDGAIKQLTEIKSKLPKNVCFVKIAIRVDNEDEGFPFGSSEEIAYVSWSEYNIKGEERCSSQANHIANGYCWKMKHQPNGIDGKKAIELYSELTK